MHIENFTGKTQITIEQDFYAQIYTFNVLQDIKHTANVELQEKHKNKNLKYEYKPMKENMIQVKEINIQQTSETICELDNYNFWGKGHCAQENKKRQCCLALCKIDHIYEMA